MKILCLHFECIFLVSVFPETKNAKRSGMCVNTHGETFAHMLFEEKPKILTCTTWPNTKNIHRDSWHGSDGLT